MKKTEIFSELVSGVVDGYVTDHKQVNFSNQESKVDHLNNSLNLTPDSPHKEYSLINSENYTKDAESLDTNLTNKKLQLGLQKSVDSDTLNIGAIVEFYEDFAGTKQARLSFRKLKDSKIYGSTIRLDETYIKIGAYNGYLVEDESGSGDSTDAPIIRYDLSDIKLVGIDTPTQDNHAANKKYVDEKIKQVSVGELTSDSTITPFVGFLPDGSTVIEESTISTDGEVLYDSDNNRFVWKDLSGTFVTYYGNWSTSGLYNNTSGSTASARGDKLFSYSDKHYMVINGTLQDISNIESMLKAYTDSAATTVQNYATSQANNALSLAKTHSNNNLTEAKEYTNNAISAKIVYCKNQADYDALETHTSEVLYLIGEE